MTTIWSGHVTISADDKGNNVITYRPDSATPLTDADHSYTPKGYFETHAVKALVKTLLDEPKGE